MPDGSNKSLRPAIIMVAPNGARRTKTDHPRLPITIDETAAEAARCRDAGASVLHLHIRDDDGAHTLDPGRYREAIAEVKRRCPDMVIQITTEAVGRYSPSEQIAVVEAVQPEAVSVALRELIPDPAHEASGLAFWKRTAECGTTLQHILYSPDDVLRFRALWPKAATTESIPQILFVLGAHSPPRDGQPQQLRAYLDALGDLIADWTVCAFGPNERACAREAFERGGHVRIGFENNLHRPDGQMASDNAELVALAVDEARKVGRGVADAATARSLMGLGGRM